MKRSRVIVASYAGVIINAGLVFIGAWKLCYWQGILYLLLAVFGTTISHLLMCKGSNLTERRASEAISGQDWDKRLLGIFFIVNVATFLVAGMDSGHFLWSGSIPLYATIGGATLMVIGQIIFALAKRENTFFSSTVQVQAERGHRVCETGLYRLVRHPGYLGMLLSVAAFPLVMASYWAFVPTLVSITILVIRTVLEDRFIMDALTGYNEYAARTKFKLIPGIF